MKRYTGVTAFGIGLAAVAACVNGAQISLNPTDVIGTSGSYPDSRFDASNILDTQTGPVRELSQTGNPPTTSGFWLNADNGPTNAYITIDLHGAYQLSEIDLYNTHNYTYNDRGTGDFSIVGGNSVSGGQLTGLTTVLVSSTLVPASSGVDPIPAQSFTVSDTGTYQYIEFEATSEASSGTPCCSFINYGISPPRSYGLNELRAFSTPEPSTLALAGIAGFGLVSRRQRS